ncbi:hypothetical protein MKW98_006286 [Papaver atlanticum]|uniref:Neprosin PEP catalytic domain-containing protein n=1 Tax=Papaver atlanticum TaxID=357466 RepID=A0AAD4XUB3_9MAGN|nr:hypothetical protein MKW98_006286 [Papaver atlanticum]
MKNSQNSFILYFILVSFTVISARYYVDGKRSISKSEEDDIEIERQLRVLNKKPVKIIMIKSGDIIDCIDIYKQPAFDNPLLKKHKIRISPDSIPGELTNKTISLSSLIGGLQKERCPSGTVPIRRTTKQDLVNAKNFIKKTRIIQANNTYPNAPTANQVKIIEGKQYFGGTAHMSLHDLTIYRDEFSTSQIWLLNGPQEQINNIEFGIMHDPLLFGDSRARLFGSWTADGHQTTGCYNMMCPGFVQINRGIMFGNLFQSTIYGKVSYDIHLMVHRAPISKDWWLSIGLTAETSEPIGYWPKELFTHLANSASNVRYGGFASALTRSSTPPMGNGYLPQLTDFTKTAFMFKMKYLNETGHMVNLDRRSMQIHRSTSPECYDLMLANPLGDFDITMAYGGPGGVCT